MHVSEKAKPVPKIKKPLSPAQELKRYGFVGASERANARAAARASFRERFQSSATGISPKFDISERAALKRAMKAYGIKTAYGMQETFPGQFEPAHYKTLAESIAGHGPGGHLVGKTLENLGTIATQAPLVVPLLGGAIAHPKRFPGIGK